LDDFGFFEGFRRKNCSSATDGMGTCTGAGKSEMTIMVAMFLNTLKIS